MPAGGYPSFGINLPSGEQFNTYSTERWPLGTIGFTQDGRRFRFCEIGGTNVAAGKLCQSPVPGANFDELAIPAAVEAGTRTFEVTNGATTITKDQFKGGFLIVEDDAGEGHLYEIASNAAEAAGSADFELTLAPGNDIQVALTTSTTVGLLMNPYKDIIIHPSPPTALVVGVTPVAISANRFGWLQTYGPCAVLIDGTVVIGQDVMPSNGTDGSVEAYAFTEGTPNALITPAIGHVIEVAATTEHGAIFLKLD